MSARPSARAPQSSECDATCAYCDRPLALTVRHEHDHVPIPRRHGGTATLCVCRECHSLKDRIRPCVDWPLAETWAAGREVWTALSPRGRIMFASILAAMADLEELRDRCREVVKMLDEAGQAGTRPESDE